jgi:hypothetical protein
MGWDVSIEEAEALSSWMIGSYGSVSEALSGVSSAADGVSGLGDQFTGATADAVKGYWSQVHGCMTAALQAAAAVLTDQVEQGREAFELIFVNRVGTMLEQQLHKYMHSTGA